MVVAANVVHATPDLRATLHNLRTMLAPGGLLVLQELIRRSAWLDLVFGQLDGWWLARDDLRAEHPMAGVAEWRRALAETGFAARRR